MTLWWFSSHEYQTGFTYHRLYSCTRAFPAKFMWQVYIESSLWCSAVYSFVWTMQEGEFASLSVRRLRKRQMRNFFVCLMVSQVRISVWSFKFFMGCAFRSLFVQGRTQGCICSQWYAGIVEYVSLVQSLSLVTWWGLLGCVRICVF